MIWKKVFATHEEKQHLSTGPWLGDEFPGVALPSTQARKRWIMLRYESNFTCAQVVDIGPWCVDDHSYVFGGNDVRPRAEAFKNRECPRIEGGFLVATVKGKPMHSCNGAGIDLFPRVARELGIKIGENVNVEWRFIEP